MNAGQLRLFLDGVDDTAKVMLDSGRTRKMHHAEVWEVQGKMIVVLKGGTK